MMDLVEAMKRAGYNYERLTKEANCALGTLSNFVGNGNVIQFDTALRIIRIILPEREQEFMFDYCKKSNMPKNLKCALEYAYLHSNVDLLDSLITVCESHKNKEIKEFALIYRLLYDRLIGKSDSNDIFNKIKDYDLASNSVELDILKDLITIYSFYQDHCFRKINGILLKIKEKLDKIENPFIKEALTIKYSQMAAFNCLHVNIDIHEARRISEESIVLSPSNRLNGFFYNILATSYFGESIELMNTYADKAIKAYSFNPKVSQDLTNRFKKLNMIMNNDYTNDFTRDNNDPLDLYIDGVMNKDIYSLIECLVELNKEGSMFFTGMVIGELKAMKCKDSLINSIQGIA